MIAMRVYLSLCEFMQFNSKFHANPCGLIICCSKYYANPCGSIIFGSKFFMNACIFICGLIPALDLQFTRVKASLGFNVVIQWGPLKWSTIVGITENTVFYNGNPFNDFLL